MNIDGDMIGINVAVSIGAEGIGFAIPVNDALETAARLMDEVVADEVYHGIDTRTEYVDDQPQLVIESIQPDSPAAKAGLVKGDRLIKVGDLETRRNSLDFRRSLLGQDPGAEIELQLADGDGFKCVQLQFAKKTAIQASPAWDKLGMKLEEVAASEMANLSTVLLAACSEGSPASAAAARPYQEGILEGDILVAMHGWKTESLANLSYILNQPELKQAPQFMFYILRDKEPFWGQLRIASRPR